MALQYAPGGHKEMSSWLTNNAQMRGGGGGCGVFANE